MTTLSIAFGQAQQVRGRIFDKKTDEPLIGAGIVLVGTQPIVGTTTDTEGHFALTVPYGRHQFAVQFIGYTGAGLSDVLVTAGKEVIIEIGLEESVTKLSEVVVKGTTEKAHAVNDMVTLSSKSFSLQEVLRYSGSRNDVARMAANFAGVFVANDQRNDLIIRGNSPTGVAYRIEGINVPNPNHFATLGTTGGPVSAINPNMLKKSDFLTGAFPAEYGNATAGVFDIGLKSGNKEKFEFTTQLAAFSGLEAMAEGPLNRAKTQSFAVAYRQSFLELLNAFNVNIGISAIPKYNDLSFKLDFGRTPIGRLSVWGLGGTSSINTYSSTTNDNFAKSKLGTIGLDHRLLIGNTAYIKTTIAYSGALSTFDNYQKDTLSKTTTRDYYERDLNKTLSIVSALNKKFGARHALRTGISADIYQLESSAQSLKETTWIQTRNFAGQVGLLRAFAQSQYKISESLTLNAGLHAQYLTLNKKAVIEPRLALKWAFTPTQNLSFGYGLHSQMQPLPVYLYQTPPQYAAENYARTNENLDFTRSQHFVLGYQAQITEGWSFKADAYYQAISRVPVEQKVSSFSVLNTGASFGFPDMDSLVNKGTGQNYGLELTLEKSFLNGYYSLLTTSFFQAKYKGSDDVTRSTAFNNQFIINVLAGKEFKVNRQKDDVITFDLKVSYAGGRRYTPIDLEKSRVAKVAVYDYANTLGASFSPFFRMDAKAGYRINDKKHKVSHHFFSEVQNLTNHANPFMKTYDAKAEKIRTSYQIFIFFDLLYRLQF
jgi:hypothetical protein